MKCTKITAPPSRARRMLAAVAAIGIAVSLLAGCAQAPAAGAGADCSHYFYSADSTVNPDQPYRGSFKLVVILLDLSSNSPQTAASIDESIHPYLRAAVSN